MLTTLLAGVAAVSLVVGGIGIMNIMLVSVTERTREIGVRLAIGARSRDILDAVPRRGDDALGGRRRVGIVLGLVGAWGVAQRRPRAVRHPRDLDAGRLRGRACSSGIVFGVLPARKAARLNPLAALRFE